jgi:hypothetical protein
MFINGDGWQEQGQFVGTDKRVFGIHFESGNGVAVKNVVVITIGRKILFDIHLGRCCCCCCRSVLAFLMAFENARNGSPKQFAELSLMFEFRMVASVRCRRSSSCRFCTRSRSGLNAPVGLFECDEFSSKFSPIVVHHFFEIPFDMGSIRSLFVQGRGGTKRRVGHRRRVECRRHDRCSCPQSHPDQP